MRSGPELTRHLLDNAYQTLDANLESLTLEEALFVPEGGFRSVLGTLKHAAGWSHVYRSFAFDRELRNWHQLQWPHGLRDKVIKSREYVDEVIAWMTLSHRQWMEALARTSDDQLEELRPVHWGESLPLYDIGVTVANHHVYHAGEINQVLSIYRSEAREEGEEVEENIVSTEGHRFVLPWRVEK